MKPAHGPLQPTTAGASMSTGSGLFGVPLVSTAFRPVAEELKHGPFRMFTVDDPRFFTH